MSRYSFIHCLLTLVALLQSTLATNIHRRQNGTFAEQCSSVVDQLTIPDSTVWFSQHVPAGTNLTFPDIDPACNVPSALVTTEVCRVALRVATTNQSEISMEAWLPSNWTGRFIAVGSGGLSGCIYYDDLAWTTARGFASVGSNSGHNGTSGLAFNENEDVIRDFAYRAVHTATVVGKSITKKFYGRQHDKSYYTGCSTGGRQGLRAAQSYPDDFDGIVAGAPAIAFNNLTSWSGHFYNITGPPNSDTFVPLNYWPAIHQDILAQCDGLDGAVDSVLEDATKCIYDPSRLLCGTSNNATICLTAKQVNTVKEIFSPFLDADGSLIYPRAQPGGELFGAPQIFYAGAPFQYAIDWFRYAVFNDPTFDATKLTLEDVDFAYKKNPGDSQSFKGDLSPFQNVGGKILTYHGQQDPIISSEISPLYYKHVQETLGYSTGQMDDFYRLFRISGLGHCSHGEGAWRIGQGGDAPISLDADYNVLSALVKWVEDGTAPETVGGANDDASVLRRHCRWPYTNKFIGGGVGDPDSWECQEQ